MPNPGDIPRAVEYSEIVLHARQVAAQMQISKQLVHDMDIRSMHDFVTDSLLYQLRTHVYTANVGDVEVTVPFAAEDTLEIPAPQSLVLPQAVATLAATAAALVEGSVLFFLVACLFALVSVYAFVRNPDYRLPWRKPGEVDVKVEIVDSFPDNSTVYPKELGRPVRIMLPPQIDVRYFDDER